MPQIVEIPLESERKGFRGKYVKSVASLPFGKAVRWFVSESRCKNPRKLQICILISCRKAGFKVSTKTGPFYVDVWKEKKNA